MATKTKTATLVVNRQSLADALALMDRVTNRKGGNPIIACVRLEGDADGLWIAATNFEQALRMRLDADGELPPTAADGKRLLEFVRNADGEDVTLIHGGHELTIKGRIKFTQRLAEATDFPAISGPRPEDEPQAVVPGNLLATALGDCESCSDESKSRYSLNGVYFDRADGMTLVGSNGKGLLSMAVADQCAESTSHCILPKHAAKLAARLWADGNGDVAVTITNNHIYMVKGDTMLMSLQVAGIYPAWRQVKPDLAKYPTRITLPVAQLLADAKRLAQVKIEAETGKKTVRWTRLDAHAEDGELRLTANGDNDAGEVVIPCETTGPAFDVSLDAALLTDGLAGWPEESITLRGKDDDSAVVAETSDGTRYFLVMPVERA